MIIIPYKISWIKTHILINTCYSMLVTFYRIITVFTIQLKIQFISLIIRTMDIEDNGENNSQNSGTEEKLGFFQSLFANLFKSANPEAEKKRKLKAIAKSFSKTKFRSFYKTSTIEVMPPLAKMFYEIYKVISPVQLMLRATPNPNYYKNHIINYMLSEKQLTLLEHFSEEKIMEMAKQMPVQNISKQIHNDLNTFTAEFDSERIVRTENIYKGFMLLRNFSNFDYYKLLKKFTNRLQENNFSTVPVFEKINAEYVVDDLADFCSVAYAITDDTIIWGDLFEFFKQTNSVEIISLSNWKKIIARVKTLQSSSAFDLLIRHASGRLKYVTQIDSVYEEIIEPYTSYIESETVKILNKLQHMQNDSKSNQLCMQIFGNTEFQSIKNYVYTANDIFSKKELNTFEYAKPLNYLKTFLLEYVKKNLREFYDIVVIRGQWISSLSAPMSNAYQELLKISDAITNFDNELAEDGPIGSKIKTLLPKTAHDTGAESIINRLISDSNDQAKSFLLTSTQALITIGKTLKQLIEDYLKQKPVIMQNWKELEKYFEIPFKDFSVDLYKKIYLFVQLMQQNLSSANGNEEY